MRSGYWALGLGLLLAGAVAGDAAAQFKTTSPGKAAAGKGSGQSGAAASPDAKVIKGISFEVKKLVRDPSTEGYRVIISVFDTGTETRKVAFVFPQATLVDDMGNVYIATSSSGLPICQGGALWDQEAEECARRQAEDLMELVPATPVTVSMAFAPKPDGVIPDTVPLATGATFNARLLVTDGKKWTATDIQLPGISMPNTN